MVILKKPLRSQNTERKIESCQKTGKFMKAGGISRRLLGKRVNGQLKSGGLSGPLVQSTLIGFY